ncbi:hypothetical protein ACIQGW_04310 [Lysinibacillus xylanilyticus]|uniref:hypothetical protein n=1 Tax=Lysinibacillus xylanilyticus TaxID=582475 RepID=UPI0038107DEA
MSENTQTNEILLKQQTALQEIVGITKGLIDMNPAYEKIHNIALGGLEEQHDINRVVLVGGEKYASTESKTNILHNTYWRKLS